MKFRNAILLAVMAFLVANCSNGIKEKTTFETVKDSASYAMGFNIGLGLKGQKIDADLEAFYAGLKDVLVDDDTLIAMNQMSKVIQKFQMEERAKAQKEAKIQAEKNKKEGEAFLAENAKKEGVKVLESGIQYKVLESGNGDSPTKENKVRVHYTGKLISGKVFDSSVNRDQPAEFVLSQVISGWTEILQLMKEGDKWEVFIPANKAYGDMGTPGGPIPPGSTLIFEISFLNIVE